MILLKRIGIIFLHVVFMTVLIAVLGHYHIMQIPDENNLVQWDAGWYKNIVSNGYVFIENTQCNLAFFPLFPFAWKWLQISAFNMSIINSIFFATGFLILAENFRFSLKQTLVFFVTPSLFFCAVPYSEALFFLASAFILSGLYKNLKWMVMVGLFFAGITRSTSMFFLPAIVVSVFLSGNKPFSKQNLTDVFIYSIVCIVSLFTVALWQWQQTGHWFYFFEVQKFWNKELAFPKLPLTTWNGPALLWIDGAALFVGLSALFYCFKSFLKWTFTLFAEITNPAFTFSCVYLIIVSVTTIFFGSTGTQTSIYSLNRYIFATAFFIVFAHFVMADKNSLNKKLIFGSGIILFQMFLFGIYSPQILGDWFQLAGIAGFAVYALYHVFITEQKIFSRYFVLFYIVNVILQLKLLDLFLNGKWVG
jgi:hypothetical protein